MRPLAPYLLFLLVCGLLSCAARKRPDNPNAPDTPPVGDTSQTSLDWSGTYLGEIADPDGNMVMTSLHLGKGGTYTIERSAETLGEEPITETGSFVWEDDGESIRLEGIDSTSRPIYYRVGENYLRQMDLVNQSIEGNTDDRYTLRKDAQGLRGNTWQLVTLNGAPVEKKKSQPTLTFAGTSTRLYGMAGCNRYSTEYSLTEGDYLDIPAPVTTKMACPELELEREFLEALEGTANFSVADETLSLTDAAGAQVATFQRQ